MNKMILIMILTGVLATFSVSAAESRPSETSVRELLAVMNSQKIVELTEERFDHLMDASIKRVLAGKKITPDQQKVLDDMRAQYVDLLKEEMSWKTLEPEVVDIYKQTLTQEEVNAMLKFYKSEAGKSVLIKMPMVIQDTSKLIQKHIINTAPKLKNIEKDAVSHLQTKHTK